MISGYKCFNEDMTNRYGKKFEECNIYFANGEIKFGNSGNGFHFCKNLEDTLRYFDMEKKFQICKVRGFGNIVSCDDEYNGYYEMYASEKIFVEKILSHEEIITYALNLNDIRAERFVSQFPLTKEEIDYFKEKFYNCPNVLEAIQYYQEKDLDTYKRIVFKY